jgi:hypothetical protein
MCEEELTTTRAILPIDQRRMGGNSIIPNDDRVGLPLDAAVQILAVREMVIQELEQEVALFLLKPNDVPRELRVDVQSLLAGRWVGADEGMDLARGLSVSNISSFPCCNDADLPSTPAPSSQTCPFAPPPSPAHTRYATPADPPAAP